ncbi:MAG: hypothetical protein ACRCVV_10280 [Shewanella sp.]
MTLYNVNIKVSGGANNQFWADVDGIHKDIELPESFILAQGDGDKVLVTHVKTIKQNTWGEPPRYSRISLFNISKSVPVDTRQVFSVQLELPDLPVPTRWEHIEKHEEVEIVIGSGGYYTGEAIVMNDGSSGWLKSKCPLKAKDVKTGNQVIVTSSSSEHRGGHGEGNITLTSLTITDLETMKPLPKDTVMMYSGIVVRPIEVIDTERHNEIKRTEEHTLSGIEKITSQFNKDHKGV